MWLHSLKVTQLLRSAACLHTNQSRSYLNHLVLVYTKVLFPFRGPYWLNIVLANTPSRNQYRRYLFICASVRLAAFFAKDKYFAFLSMIKRGRFFLFLFRSMKCTCVKHSVTTERKLHFFTTIVLYRHDHCSRKHRNTVGKNSEFLSV